MSIRIYELDRRHVIDTEIRNIYVQYIELMAKYEIPWNDEDWWFRKPERVRCYEIMGNLYAMEICKDGGYYVYTKEHCNYTYGREYDRLIEAFEGILDEFRR